MINLIWAMDINWLIGKNNKLPWRYKEDLLYFKQMTHNKTVLMGEKTYQSLKFEYYKDRDLPFKKIYVATLDKNKTHPNVIMINNVNEFLTNFKEELWVVGGATIYNLAIPFADKLYITWVLNEHEGDSYFSKFDLDNDFKLLSEEQGKTNELKFSIYGRVK